MILWLKIHSTILYSSSPNLHLCCANKLSLYKTTMHSLTYSRVCVCVCVHMEETQQQQYFKITFKTPSEAKFTNISLGV